MDSRVNYRFSSRYIVSCLLLAILLFGCLCGSLCGCAASSADSADEWGSFSSESKQYSYDNSYYSIQTVGDETVDICIYSASDDELVFEVQPCRSNDYWGMVWENGRNAFWIQSGDVGVFCYELVDDEWCLNADCERPEDIVSRYDVTLSQG